MKNTLLISGFFGVVAAGTAIRAAAVCDSDGLSVQNPTPLTKVAIDPMEKHSQDRPKLGDTLKDFSLPVAVSRDESDVYKLRDALKEGPVVVTFFRGSWCPYCRNELSSIQDNFDQINKLGATVVAISPERSEPSKDLAEKLELGFTVAHDQNNELARALGLTFELDAATIKRYKQYGIDLPESNGTERWELPVPATYVLDQDGIIRYLHDDEDYTNRVTGRDVVKALKEINEDG